jgi:hypothetical protein
MTALLVVETVVLAVLTVLVAGLLRAYGSVLRRLERLDGGDRSSGGQAFALGSAVDAIGSTAVADPTGFGPAHDITGQTPSGEFVHARVTGVDHNTLLLFLSSGCASCAVFWDELQGTVPLPARTRLLVVPQGPEDESVAALTQIAPEGIDVVLSSAAWRDYEVPGAPHAVFVDGPNGQVRGEGTGSSLRQVAELLARATGDAGFVTTDPTLPKSRRDQRDELHVDRALLQAGILPGDPRLYGAARESDLS